MRQSDGAQMPAHHARRSSRWVSTSSKTQQIPDAACTPFRPGPRNVATDPPDSKMPGLGRCFCDCQCQRAGLWTQSRWHRDGAQCAHWAARPGAGVSSVKAAGPPRVPRTSRTGPVACTLPPPVADPTEYREGIQHALQVPSTPQNCCTLKLVAPTGRPCRSLAPTSPLSNAVSSGQFPHESEINSLIERNARRPQPARSQGAPPYC